MAFDDPLVTTADIDDGAVTAAKIAAGAVVFGKIAADAVDTAAIAAGAVTASEIANDAVGTAAIAPGAVTSTEIGAGAVTSPALAALAVTAAAIADGAVATAKIANGAVDSTKIANAAITNALIANAAISTAQIQNGAITTALIANLAVTTALIADLAVTSAKIGSLSADKITAGTITASVSLTAATITGGTITGVTITGVTITGGTLRTASSGARVEMSSAAVTTLNFYSGAAGETAPGKIIAGGDMTLQGSNLGFGFPSILLRSNNTIGSHTIVLTATTLDIESTTIRNPIGVYNGALAAGQGGGQIGASGPWSGWNGIGPNVSFTKTSATSALLIMFTFSCFTTAGGPLSFGIAGDAGGGTPGTIRSSQVGYINPANTHTSFHGFHRITGLGSGPWTFRVAINPGGAGFQADANDFVSMAIIECS